MEKIRKKLGSHEKFTSKFFKDELNEAYSFYIVLLKFIGFLGLLAISISLLGMLGMVVYTSETRTKEIGIRKVLGATTTMLALMLSRDYLLLMIWAAIIFLPFATWVIDNMLQRYQYYHAPLNFWDVLLSLLFLLVLGLSTIASPTFKTASTNPSETLRSE